MAMDGIAVKCTAFECNQLLQNARMDKIYQPEQDEIVLVLRTDGGNVRLVLSASANHARVHLTQQKKENPMQAPFFCMLLRKHLIPSRLVRITQQDFERVLILEFACTTELGDPTTKYLIAELMGRHSNLIFTEQDGRIIDSVKHIDARISSVRQVLPGLMYQGAPSQHKKNPLTATVEELSCLLAQEDRPLQKLLLQTYTGLSPLACREIAFRISGNCDVTTGALPQNAPAQIADFFAQIRENRFQPTLVMDGDKSIEFAAFPPTQYQGAYTLLHPATFSDTLERYYAARDVDQRQHQRAAAMEKMISNFIERCSKKCNIYRQTIKDASDKELQKQLGDLIMANAYQIRPGDSSLTVSNFYAPDNAEITIRLDPQKTTAQNAQRCYTRYTKQKTAEKMAQEQLTASLAELEYLESVQQFLENAKTPSELSELRDELHSQGYLAKGSKGKRQKQKRVKPRIFRSSDGFLIYVGKNNLQNDAITFQLSRSRDLWLHTKNIPGSHTLIVRGNAQEIPDRTVEEAAMLCALHSKAKNGVKIPVDYTECKNVKKIPGAKPGMVIYDHFNTAYVTPNPALAEQLEEK